jgi:multisubunit Na+/H+ antiporter MnhG subunit
MGTMLLTVAMFVQQGFTVLSWKTLLIAVVMLGINSVVAHATARAFRVREVGHWEHRHGDGVEIIDDRTARSAP